MAQFKETAVAERRKETRYDTGNCTAEILLTEPEMILRGNVVDVSRSGLRLRTHCHLEAQRMLTVRFGAIVVAGRVRYCTLNQDNTFDTGVLICDINLA